MIKYLIYCLLFASVTTNIILFRFYNKSDFIDPNVNRSKLMQISCGFLLSRAVQVFSKLRLADYLKQPQKIDKQFSDSLKLNQEMLYRLLRMLSAHGIVSKNSKDEFVLTEMGQYLRTDHPETLRNFFEMEGNSRRWTAYTRLEDTLKTGESSFNLLFGESYFDSIKKNHIEQDEFNRGMNDISSNENYIIAKFFKNMSISSIVDIGGGVGELLLDIKNVNHVLKEAILFDYTPLTVDQINLLKDNNIDFIQGSFFEANIIPENKDVYLLKRILHDWNDVESINILNKIQKSMSSNSRLYILDSIMDDSNDYHISKDIDFEMMVLFGGKERTEKEFENIFKKSNLKLANIYTLEKSMLSIIEVHKI